MLIGRVGSAVCWELCMITRDKDESLDSPEDEFRCSPRRVDRLERRDDC